LSDVISLGATVGLDLLLRLPAELQNNSTVVRDAQSSALGWFYGAGRFLYPETRLFLRWHFSEPVDLLVNVRALYPVFHLWDGSGQPFWDALVISGGVGFAVRLAAPAAPLPSSP
jgi:hypothetical protein